MLKFLKSLPNISLIALLAICVVVSALFWLGGSQEVEIAGNPWDQPNFTDTLLNWTYFLLGLTLFITLGLSLFQFVGTFISNPKKGIVMLGVIVVFVLVFVVSWAMGTGETLNIIGYEGTDNTGFWGQYSDMCLYATYILGSATVVALLGSIVYSKLK